MVECHLAKVDVEGSNPFSRSKVFAALDEPQAVTKSARDEFRDELFRQHARCGYWTPIVIGPNDGRDA